MPRYVSRQASTRTPRDSFSIRDLRRSNYHEWNIEFGARMLTRTDALGEDGARVNS
jgi:hypothetical protein